MIRERVDAAKKETIDFVSLWTDEADNKSQVLQMLTEGGEAGLAGYQLFKDLDKEDALKAGIEIGYAIAGHFKDALLKYSDEIEPA